MKDTNQISELVGEITYLNEEYRAGNQQVTDQEYDLLLDKLKEIDPTNPIFKKGIIETVKSNPRMRKLAIPMMSMNKCKSVQEIKDWLSSLGCKDDELIVITPKYNGISILNDCRNQSYSTRGDGEYGQDCDKHFNLIEMKPVSDEVTVGEAIISRKNWDKHFKGKISPRGTVYKLNNATVSGLLNMDDATGELSYIDFVRYSIFDGIEEFGNKHNQLNVLEDEYGSNVEYSVIELGDLTEEFLDAFYEENNKVYPIDGLVIDIDRFTLRNKLGRELNGNPAYARALKLDKWVEEFNTVITGHNFTISKQGKLKGVVTFEPVIINGTEVKQASFYNAKFLLDMCLCDRVNITVKKSGEIIPKIVKVEGIKLPIKSEYKDQKLYESHYKSTCIAIEAVVGANPNLICFNEAIGYCPSCGELMQWDENKVELICSNPDCEQMLVSKLEHFFTALEIEEMGRPTIQTLFNNDYTSPYSILNMDRLQYSIIPGLGETSAETIISQFEKLKSTGVPLARLMYACDVFEGGIGEKTAQLILDETKYVFGEVNSYDLIKIKGVSDTTAQCYLNGLDKFSHMETSIPISYITTPEKVVRGNKYANLSFCFSGVRDKKLEDEITAQGGQIVSSVSKNTTYLVVLDLNSKSSKTVKAREVGCKIMTIEQFKKI